MTFGPNSNNDNDGFNPLDLFFTILGGASNAKDIFSSPEKMATGIPGFINITDALGDSTRLFGPNVAQRSSHGYRGSQTEPDGSISYFFNLAGFKSNEINISLNNAKSEVTVIASKGEIDVKNPIFGLVSEKVKVAEGTTERNISTKYEDGLLTINVKQSLFEDEDSTIIKLS